ncbi:MAG: ion channel [Bacteroidia bacterium]
MFNHEKHSSSKKKVANDLGFGLNSAINGKRALNKDGSFNVVRKGVPFFQSFEVFHKLIAMSWLKFNFLVFAFYTFANLFFAVLYWQVGVSELSGIDGTTAFEKFMNVFFFSAQTLTTLGYGKMAPIQIESSMIASIESMVGLLGFALATGLLYGRFSRPVAKIMYSKNALIAPYKDSTAFEFRMINGRSNQLIEVEMEVILFINNKHTKTREYLLLPLERDRLSLFPMNWTIVHHVDEKSPLYEITEKELLERDAEFIILLKAFDDSFSQTIYSRHSYMADELIWGQKFANMLSISETGMRILHIDKLNETSV